MYPIVAKPGLYLRRQDSAPSEPINAATFHQIGRTLTASIIDLESLAIDHEVKSENASREIIAQVVAQAASSLSDLCSILEHVQDEPTPVTCPRCTGRGWIGQSIYGKERKPCERCGGSGTVEQAYT
jgi:DnaJ-class molecular chaperone